MSKKLFDPLILNIALDGDIYIDPSHTGEGGEDDRNAGDRATFSIGNGGADGNSSDLFE